MSHRYTKYGTRCPYSKLHHQLYGCDLCGTPPESPMMNYEKNRISPSSENESTDVSIKPAISIKKQKKAFLTKKEQDELFYKLLDYYCKPLPIYSTLKFFMHHLICSKKLKCELDNYINNLETIYYGLFSKNRKSKVYSFIKSIIMNSYSENINSKLPTIVVAIRSDSQFKMWVDNPGTELKMDSLQRSIKELKVPSISEGNAIIICKGRNDANSQCLSTELKPYDTLMKVIDDFKERQLTLSELFKYINLSPHLSAKLQKYDKLMNIIEDRASTISDVSIELDCLSTILPQTPQHFFQHYLFNIQNNEELFSIPDKILDYFWPKTTKHF